MCFSKPLNREQLLRIVRVIHISYSLQVYNVLETVNCSNCTQAIAHSCLLIQYSGFFRSFSASPPFIPHRLANFFGSVGVTKGMFLISAREVDKHVNIQLCMFVLVFLRI